MAKYQNPGFSKQAYRSNRNNVVTERVGEAPVVGKDKRPTVRVLRPLRGQGPKLDPISRAKRSLHIPQGPEFQKGVSKKMRREVRSWPKLNS